MRDLEVLRPYLLISNRAGVRAWSSLRTGVLPTLTTCLGLWTDVAGLVSSAAAGDEPVETPADGGEVLSDRWAGEWELLDVRRDVDGSYGLEPVEAHSRSHQSMNRETAR